MADFFAILTYYIHEELVETTKKGLYYKKSGETAMRANIERQYTARECPHHIHECEQKKL